MKYLLVIMLLVACGKDEKTLKEGDLDDYAKGVVDKVVYQDEQTRIQEKLDLDEYEAQFNLNSATSCKIVFKLPALAGKIKAEAQFPSECEQVFDDSYNRVYIRYYSKTYVPLDLTGIYIPDEVGVPQPFSGVLTQLDSTKNYYKNMTSTQIKRNNQFPSFLVLKANLGGIAGVELPEEFIVEYFKIPPAETEQ